MERQLFHRPRHSTDLCAEEAATPFIMEVWCETVHYRASKGTVYRRWAGPVAVLADFIYGLISANAVVRACFLPHLAVLAAPRPAVREPRTRFTPEQS